MNAKRLTVILKSQRLRKRSEKTFRGVNEFPDRPSVHVQKFPVVRSIYVGHFEICGLLGIQKLDKTDNDQKPWCCNWEEEGFWLCARAQG